MSIPTVTAAYVCIGHDEEDNCGHLHETNFEAWLCWVETQIARRGVIDDRSPSLCVVVEHDGKRHVTTHGNACDFGCSTFCEMLAKEGLYFHFEGKVSTRLLEEVATKLRARIACGDLGGPRLSGPWDAVPLAAVASTSAPRSQRKPRKVRARKAA